jgi:hypothetical protein
MCNFVSVDSTGAVLVCFSGAVSLSALLLPFWVACALPQPSRLLQGGVLPESVQQM